ncbi:MAG: DNA repair protein RadA, partial [Actinomycetes bacterium]
MAAPKTQYSCTDCGWSTPKWVGQCGSCQSWDTLREVSDSRGLGSGRAIKPAVISEDSRARPITEISILDSVSWSTQIGEFDRVLGGGL